MDGGRDIRGYKGGGDQQAGSVESPDNLQSIAYAHVLDLWCEGEIKGFVHPTNVLQDVALNETPAANADGSLNFKNVQFDSRAGTQGQVYMSGFPDVENEISVGVELKSATPWTQTISNLQLTAVRVTLSVPAITQQDANTNQITGYTIQYAIDVKTDGGDWQQAISSAFTGKSTSKYQRQHKIDLPAATTGWTIRVRRLTPNQNKITVADTTTVDSYTEIIDAKFRYPNSAYGGLVVDSSQFSSIPTRAFNLYGRIVSIPSNYDPDTRAYTGTWDGTFKPGWTNNPAWMFYDVATNDRFGLGQYMPAALVDKWTLYTIAQYCDELVPDGFGGMEPRFYGFVYLRTQADAFKVMQDLASLFRGVNYWAGGAVHAVADMPGDPEYTYTAANVIGGKFTYSGSSRKTRYTVALVSWSDPDDFGRAKVEYISDDVGIARYGVQVTQVTAFGAMSRGVARRMGKGILLSSRLQTEMVTFQVGLDGQMAVPGQIIRVADPARAGKRQGGRIHSATATKVTVDSAPGQVAVGDALTCTLPSGVTETHAITAISGKAISVASPGFSEVPGADSVWTVESASLTAALYRVVGVADDSVTDDDGNSKIIFTIGALQHNASKYDAIDLDEPISVPPVSVIPPSVQPGPDSVTITSVETSGAVLAATSLTIQWLATTAAVRYQCEYRKDNGDWQSLGTEITGLSVDIHNALPGVYVARVRAFNAANVGSVPTQSDSYTVADQTRMPTTLSDIKTQATNAAADAAAATTQLAEIASDNVLSPAEKPTVMRDYSVITTEQAGIDAQADAYGTTTQKSDYDNAISTLTAYLNTLNTAVPWNNKSGYTDINGPTFRGYFNSVYAARQTLLNAIYAAAKAKADAAQDTANTAQSLASQVAVLNAGFDAGDTGWQKGTGWSIKSDGSFGYGQGYAQHVGGSDGALRNNAVCFVQPGHSYTVQALIKAISANGSCYARISWRDVSDSEISTTNGNLITGTTVAGSFATGTAPAGAIFAHAEIATASHTTGKYQVDNVVSTLQPATADEINESASRKWAGESGADVTAGKSIDVLTNGSTYARIRANNLTSGNLDLAKPAVAGKTLANITDAGGRFAAAEAGADKTAGKSIDVLADGTNYRRTGAGYVDTSGRVTTLWDGTAVRSAVNIWDGANRARTGLDTSGRLTTRFATARLIAGQSFDGSADLPIPMAGLTDDASYSRMPVGSFHSETVDNATFAASITADGSVPGWKPFASGALTYVVSAAYNNANVLDISGSTVNSGAECTRKYPCKAGDYISAMADMYWANGNLGSRFQIRFYQQDGTAFTSSTGNIEVSNTATSTWQTLNPKGPAPTNAAYFTLLAYSPATDGLGHALLTNVRLSVNDLRVAGSGVRSGDQRNSPSSLTRNLGIVRSATALTSHSSGAVDINAHTITMGEASIPYNAKSNAVTGLTVGNSYYIYTRDNYAGGSPTYAATANSNTVNSFDDAYNAGVVTIPSSGTGGGGGGGLGPGVPCVCADMWLRPGLTARDLANRWRWWKPQLWFLQGPDGWHLVRRRPRVVPAPSCRVTVADGSTIDCSNYTPVTTQTGESVLAPMLHGHLIATESGWQRVLDVQLLPGSRDVVRINAGGNSFFAGADPYRRISTHNEYKP